MAQSWCALVCELFCSQIHIHRWYKACRCSAVKISFSREALGDIFLIFSHSWIDWPELKGEKDPGWYLFTGAITNLTNMMEKMKQTMFLLFFNEWMNEGSLPKRGCKNGFAGYAKSWYLFCQCLLQCSIIALMPFVFFPPLTPSERLIICWWSLCFVLLQQHDWGWWDVYQEVL